jgi:indole-3-glycerol phosphate synthase
MKNNSKNSEEIVGGFLDEIVKKKRQDLSCIVETNQSIERTGSSGFKDAITVNSKNKIALIAEIKFASPTSKNLGSPDDFLLIAKRYKKAKVNAISIITEKHYFKGDISFITKIKNQVSIPVLQKDFVIDPRQIYEANEIGSDALLLIARLVTVERLAKFVEICFTLGIEPVVEIANNEDLKKAILTGTNIIAVNARDLDTFTIDIPKACELVKRIPGEFVKLGFSGISSHEDVEKYRIAGVTGVLVGTNLMKAENVDKFIATLDL